ncbi:MAG TPA: hypothetical protein VFN10_22595 [Thermoanaerobaculia bacterium]|nr:hypothetical protein [Thermoanaerobaculia bacterium]
MEGARIGVYREALEYHQKRTVLLAGDYYDRAMDATRPRAMTVTGLHKLASLVAVTRAIDRGIAQNKTTSDIADDVSAIVNAHGETVLSGNRIELIVHNALFTAHAAGEWKAAMEFVDDRPYFQYRGPDDDRNSAICDRIIWLIVHYTDPILKHMWHPNHHSERKRWESLATDEVDHAKVYRSADGFEYPVVNGQIIRPADGWDFNAADAMAADDAAFSENVRKLGEQLGRKTPADYALAPLAEIDIDRLPKAPPLGNVVPQGAIERAWEAFQRAVGIENGSGTWALDYANEGVRLNRDTFDIALTDAGGNFSGAGGRYFPLLLPTLQSPFESWLVPFATDKGTTFIKRYIGLFITRSGEVQSIVLDRADDAWLWRVIAPRNVEAYRAGLLLRSHGRTGS